jgi:hypothetical protein
MLKYLKGEVLIEVARIHLKGPGSVHALGEIENATCDASKSS